MKKIYTYAIAESPPASRPRGVGRIFFVNTVKGIFFIRDAFFDASDTDFPVSDAHLRLKRIRSNDSITTFMFPSQLSPLPNPFKFSLKLRIM